MKRWRLMNRLPASPRKQSFTESFSTSPNAKLPHALRRNPEELECRQIRLFGTILPKPLGCSGISNKPYEIRDHSFPANQPIPHPARQCQVNLSGVPISACRRPNKIAKYPQEQTNL